MTVSGSSLFLFLFFHSGKDDTYDVPKYLSCITQAIQEKVAVMLASAHFFATSSVVERNGKILFLMWLQCHAWKVLFKGKF